MKQGEILDINKVLKIKDLLKNTELSLGAIAERFGLTVGCVSRINRKNRIRLYQGKRNSWKVNA